MTDAGSPPPASPQVDAAPGGYRVLARKYRPSHFGDLIGQDAMVRTLSNAFETGRIPHAWILTGVRGVGKTTTARILARALNYELPDGSVAAPTIHMQTLGVHCRAIIEGRHIDVLEMDAASHTGVDDVRQINDGVRYAPTSARYKVYIIDEVHMLSTAAFNAFLKTLEEPPEHARFVFATTEIRKVPITVLSRCQRFDLRRVETGVLAAHLASIIAREGVSADDEALGVIARAAEGSVRDALSLLDQAIAHADGRLDAGEVRRMLGLADRTRVIDLFEHLARGDIASAFTEFRDQYDTGADPVVVLSDLAEFVNLVTRIKVVPATADNIALGESERMRGRDFAAKLSMRALSRMWQMLLKGISEVQAATRPQAAAEMVLVRIAYAADLPTPDEAIRMMTPETGDAAASAAGVASSHAPSPRVPSSAARPRAAATARAPQPASPQPASSPAAATPALRLDTFAGIVALAGTKRDLALKTALEADVRFVAIEDGRLEIALEPGAARTLANDLGRKLEQWTGRRWTVIVSNAEGAPTLRAQAEAARDRLTDAARGHPHVRAVLAYWPGATIETVRRLAPESPVADAETDDGGADQPDNDD